MERISYDELPNGLYQSVYAVENYLNNSLVDHKLLELLRYRISQINNCLYCLDMHFKEAKADGETDLRLYSISAWREASYYSEKERIALHLAERLTMVSESAITDQDFEDLTKFFSKDEIADLTLAIAQINTWNRLTAVFRFEAGKYEVAPKHIAQ
ncbi:MAG: carboxymuconolactone decarboxylase family protein [Roseivirga sp.]|nr:carboxymuconolactone decarboxylase family protein [Roseivirga sp.]